MATFTFLVEWDLARHSCHSHCRYQRQGQRRLETGQNLSSIIGRILLRQRLLVQLAPCVLLSGTHAIQRTAHLGRARGALSLANIRPVSEARHSCDLFWNNHKSRLFVPSALSREPNAATPTAIINNFVSIVVIIINNTIKNEEEEHCHPRSRARRSPRCYQCHSITRIDHHYVRRLGPHQHFGTFHRRDCSGKGWHYESEYSLFDRATGTPDDSTTLRQGTLHI